ncbi:MAG TPA: hypothetical protein PKC23_12890 [Candidatus Desulfobacillus sp.]|nr:hypothetical protein [Candidatus Desulfobacillus sp.]
MDALVRLRRLGFRKWYERQLLESHLYLVTCLLGLIAVLSAIELFGARRSAGEAMLAIAVGLGGVWVCLFCWRRYSRILRLAERLGDHAHCPRCDAYARFEIVDGGRALDEATAGDGDPREVWLRARCRKCGCEWTL